MSAQPIRRTFAFKLKPTAGADGARSVTVDRIDPEGIVGLPLRAKSSRAVRAMLQALHATEEEGVDSALALGFEPAAQVLWVDEDGTIAVWPPPSINALVIKPGEPLHI